VFIAEVDAALERLLRQRLPLPENVGDVSFDQPTSTWSAQLSRITVNLFLHDIQRSGQPSRSSVRQIAADGTATRRRPQPMLDLGYLVSVWAGSPRDEHHLLGDVVSILAGVEVLPDQVCGEALGSSVHLSLSDARTLPREVWLAAGGTARPSVILRATVAADSFDWEAEPPAVDRISALASRMAEG
jgi:hypothetical protein